MPITKARLAQIDTILEVKQYELYSCMQRFNDIESEDTSKVLVVPLTEVDQITHSKNTEIEINVTPISEANLPKVTNKKVEQAVNNGLYATDSEDEFSMHGDDDEDAVMEDCQSSNDSDSH